MPTFHVESDLKNDTKIMQKSFEIDAEKTNLRTNQKGSQKGLKRVPKINKNRLKMRGQEGLNLQTKKE